MMSKSIRMFLTGSAILLALGALPVSGYAQDAGGDHSPPSAMEAAPPPGDGGSGRGAWDGPSARPHNNIDDFWGDSGNDGSQDAGPPPGHGSAPPDFKPGGDSWGASPPNDNAQGAQHGGPGGGRGGWGGNFEQRREQFRERLQNMPPEQRDEIMKRMQERQAKREKLREELMSMPPEQRKAKMEELRSEFQKKREERRQEMQKKFQDRWNGASDEDRAKFCNNARQRCNQDGGGYGCDLAKQACTSGGE